MEPRPASFSAVTMAQMVLPNMTNPAGRMHGGEVMKLMDSATGVVALERNGRPTPVPPLLLESEEQKMRFEEARLRVEQSRKEAAREVQKSYPAISQSTGAEQNGS